MRVNWWPAKGRWNISRPIEACSPRSIIQDHHRSAYPDQCVQFDHIGIKHSYASAGGGPADRCFVGSNMYIDLPRLPVFIATLVMTFFGAFQP